MKISAGTDVGIVRQNNQDAYRHGELPGGVWAIVCDGMGGHAGGNVASSIAVERISSCIENNFRDTMNSVSIKNMLESAIISANIEISDKAKKDSSLKGMGTTVVVAVCVGDSAVIAHVGDSRCYYISDSVVKFVTKDHSLVQELVDAGYITPEEAKTHPRKNIITRALGADMDDVDVEFNDLMLLNGDLLVLCSDGLSNHVTPEEIIENTASDDVHNYADRLIRLANNKGGTDNITAVLIKN